MHRIPGPESNFETSLSEEVTVSLDRSAIAQLAGDVPANFAQLAQEAIARASIFAAYGDLYQSDGGHFLVHPIQNLGPLLIGLVLSR